MEQSPRSTLPTTANVQSLLAYVADLELEVDRLRRHVNFLQEEARESLKQIQTLCREATASGDAPPPLPAIWDAAKELSAVVRDLQESPGYHPAHDQVVAIAVRPLAEQVFRWQQRLVGAPHVVLRLGLEQEHVEWFPARLRHILDNLMSNALKFRDPAKSQAWVELAMRPSAKGYEFRVTDNGVGMGSNGTDQTFATIYRNSAVQAVGPGVGLAVIKLLVEQSGGTITAHSADGEGSTFVVVLPRYEVDDFLT
jgi:signal transduction histidine kinase